MAEFDLIIRGGTVVDGTRIPRYVADLGIQGGRIAAIGKIAAHEGRRSIDADGLIVAPGVIDLHTHYDAQLFWDPYCSLSGWHGVTSAVIGNCGFGFAPFQPEMRERAMLTMTRVEAIPKASMEAGLPWDWVTYPEFLDSVERAPKAINILPYVPVGPLLTWVLGLEDAKAGRKPTDDEHQELRRLFEEALDAGGCGWSAQRMPPWGPASVQRDYDGTPMVTDVMHDETCFMLAQVLGDRNEGFIQMLYVAGDPDMENKFFEEVAAISRRPILFNVVQAFDARPHIHRRQLDWLDRCHKRGLRIYGQGLTTDAGYSFSFDEWNMFDDVECWRDATLGSKEERLAKLADPARREDLRNNLPVTATVPIRDIVIVEPQTPETEPYRDHTVGLAAEKMGKHPVDAMLDVAVADGLDTVFFAMPPNSEIAYLNEIVEHDHIIFGVSDGGAHTKFLTAGRYPTETLTKVVRTHQMIDLEEAHWRLSALPAMLAGFKGRGQLREGAPADIIVYDYENLAIEPIELVHDLPGGEWRRVQRASGYRCVVVNGEVTIEDDREVQRYPGRLLRHGRPD
ncbi:MAG: amidohydrolase family protein [Myxococcales bacterium]|nr:amidohydrolase family protein [Myxococcales bacterium]